MDVCKRTKKLFILINEILKDGLQVVTAEDGMAIDVDSGDNVLKKISAELNSL